MFNKFKKKLEPKPEPKLEPKPEPKKYYFEKEDINLLYEYYDRVKDNPSATNKYVLWGFIYEKLNLDSKEGYRINTDDILNPYVIEIKN